MSKGNVVFSNFLWRFAERCGAQLVTFIVSIVLARILDPEQYGSIALIVVFTSILQLFVDSGLGNSLIQKKDADDLDFSTVFYTNIVFCTVLYAAMFIAAPFIAEYYNNLSLIWPIRVLSLTVLLSGVKNVQQAYVSRNMLFKRFFFSTLGGTLGAAVLGLSIAFIFGKEYGIWALVAQQVFNVAVDTLILWITVKWRPKKIFSFARLKRLYSFGWKLLVSNVISTIYDDIRQLVIGKMYSPDDLAYYNRANQFPVFIVNNINVSIDSVLLPAMSNEQDDKEHLKNMVRRSVTVSIYIMAPLMLGMTFVAKPLILMLLTDKWAQAIPFLRVFCITYMFRPIYTANRNAMKAIGRSDMILKYEIITKLLEMILLVSTMWFGTMVMAYTFFAGTIMSQVINSIPNKKLLNYGYFDQLKDVLPSILLSLVMGVSVFFFEFLPLPNVVILIIQVIIGAVIYISGSVIFKFEPFLYVWNIIKPMINKIFHKKSVQ